MQTYFVISKLVCQLKAKIFFLSLILTLCLINNFGIGNFNTCTPALAAGKEAHMSTNVPHTFVLYSPAFKSGERIPTQFTADGANVSPPLSWGVSPDKTQSFALICDDPDAPIGIWVHWIVYDIPADQRNLAQGIPPQPTLANGTKQGITSFQCIGYGGPSPPLGKVHRYFFKLYALDSMSGLPAGASTEQFRSFVQAHTIAKAELMGKYKRAVLQYISR